MTFLEVAREVIGNPFVIPRINQNLAKNIISQQNNYILDNGGIGSALHH